MTNLTSVTLMCLRILYGLLFIVCMNVLTGCHYYKAATAVNSKTTTLVALEKLQRDSTKYVIVHFEDKRWHIKNMTLNTTANTLTGTFEEIGAQYIKYNALLEHRNTARYKKSKSKDVLVQVHMYITEYSQGRHDDVSIPLAAVKKIDVYKKAVGASVASSVSLGIVLIGVPLTIILLGIGGAFVP